RGAGRVLVTFLLVLAHGIAGHAQQGASAELEAKIFARMLAYDRALKARAGSSVGIAVLVNGEDKASARSNDQMLEAFKALESVTIQGLPVTVSSRTYKDPADLTAWIAREGIDALYLTRGLAGELEGIRSVCRERKVVSMSHVRSFVEQGVAVGVVMRGDAPRTVVNIAAAESMGMDLDSKLLQLSEVIR
ncbi:MAG TPA: YfiR family protein, partial [Candidatus Methylomirabilis sp.]